MNLFMGYFYVPCKCPHCGETMFIVINKDGDIISTVKCDPLKEYIDEKTVEKKDS